MKSLIGVNKQQSINHLRIKEKDLGNNEEMTEAFNVHFSTIAGKLRNLLPDVPFHTSKLSNCKISEGWKCCFLNSTHSRSRCC